MLELTLRSTAILAAAWLLIRVLPRATASTRHLVWHVALLATLLAPWTTVLPTPRIAILPPVPQVAHVLHSLDNNPSPRSVLPAGRVSSRSADQPSTGRADAVMLPTFAQFSVLGSLIFGLWFTAGWIAAWRLTRRAARAPAEWQLEVNALSERLRLRREVRVGVIDARVSPLATGLFRANILLPRAAHAWSRERRHAVLLHELAHIDRRDCRVQLIAQAACALYWFNPLVWMAASALRRERERACDDVVLRSGALASSYATHLLDIARQLRPSMAPSAALAMARPSELEGRLLSVLAAGRARVPFRGTRWAVVTVLSLATAAALAASSAAPVNDGTTAVVNPRYIVADDVMRAGEAAPIARTAATSVLQSSADPHDRELATLALAFTSGQDVIPALLHALADPDSQVREKAAIGLALRRDDRVVEPLIAAMSDPDAQVREKAAIALGTSGDPRAQDALRRALNDADAQVREKAAAGLILFGLTR
jgi:beta-lactamase regulating signal transducer with metallopeptidase domain